MKTGGKNYFKVLLAILKTILILAFCVHCQKKPEISFYYWKTIPKLSQIEKKFLQNFQTKEIYLRFFDVEKKARDKVLFVGTVEKIPLDFSVGIIPVVYITNHTFHNFEIEDSENLAEKIYSKILQITNENNRHIKEIQIDCDWTEITRVSYFIFIKKLKLISQKRISTTIRLHQVKYFHRTGIPPADTFVLMFYNMGNLKNKEKNSIFNQEDALLYIQSLNQFPHKLDIAVPIFSWVIHRRGKSIQNLLKNFDLSILQNKGILEIGKSQNIFLVTKSMLTGGRYFKKGDELQLEKISVQDLQEMAKILKKHNKRLNRKIILFDLDETNLSNYSYETLDHFCNSIF